MENIFLNIGLILITGILGFIGWIIKKFVNDLKGESNIFREQLRLNSDEHRDIIISMVKLSEHLPDIKECEDDVEKLQRSDLEQWGIIKSSTKMLEEHDIRIKELHSKL